MTVARGEERRSGHETRAKVAPPQYWKWTELNSGTQQAIVIKLEISSKYLIQYILGENLGNPCRH